MIRIASPTNSIWGRRDELILHVAAPERIFGHFQLRLDRIINN